MTEKTVLTASEVAEILGVNTQTIYRLTKRGDIPYFKVGSCTRFSKSQIDAWINGRDT